MTNSAAAHCAAHDCEQAIPLLEDSLRLHPSDPQLCYQLGLCYSGACRLHSLVSAPIATVFFNRALQLLGPDGDSRHRAMCLEALGNTLHLAGDLPAARLRLLDAATLFRLHGPRDDWARIEFNLGNLCSSLASSGARQNLWSEAIQHYSHALQVRREASDPLRFAATALNLGAAWRESRLASPQTRLRRAIGCYAAAFRAFSRAHRPDKLPGLHNNLGNAYLELSFHDPNPCRRVRRALAHFARALPGRPHSTRPRDYAATQFNRAQGFLLLAPCGAPNCTSHAARCFREARDAFLLCGDAAHAQLATQRLASLNSPA